MRIKFTQDVNGYKAGDIVIIEPELAKKYIRQGVAMLTKEMSRKDYRVKSK